MATPSSPPPVPVPVPPPASPPASQSPTIHVYYSTRHVKARIDPGVPLAEIIRQLTQSTQLSISEPSTLFCLRLKSTGQLITPSNLHQLITSDPSKKNVLMLTSTPEMEAIETIDKLSSTSSLPTLKLATFSLKTMIKDQEFRIEFLKKRNGWIVLQQVVERSGGNTLAYALTAARDTLELEPTEAKRACRKEFTCKLVEIIGKKHEITLFLFLVLWKKEKSEN